MTTSSAVTAFSDIKGWFTRLDRELFDRVLSVQDDHPGTLVELGAYLGRSAVIIGDHQQPDEPFVVIDLFGTDAGDVANSKENQYSYTTLDRTQFEQNYLALHPRLPTVITGPSSVVMDHVEPESVRFLHIDASHLYEHVVIDLANARTMLRPDGVVVMDDYRSAHTPGVAAATWGAVLNDGLVPFAITPHKLYGTWGDPTPYREAIRALVKGRPGLRLSVQTVHGHEIIRTWTPTKPKAAAPARPAPTTTRGKLEAALRRRARTWATAARARTRRPSE